MDFFCIVFGCPTTVKPDGSDNGQTRLCPRCSNVAVIGAKKAIWNCSICGWHADQSQPPPPLPGPPPNAYNPHYQQNYGPPPGQQQWAQPYPNSFQGQPGHYQQPGYGPQPGYGYNPGR
ncbi:hypothetical protein OPQ81_001920 [Rhizoctonia solani]|nr:hypothetical protein OPQ81_001920 [Rhizoctonia solani]